MTRLIDATEAAAQLGVSKHQVLSAYRSGLLPHRKVGRLIRFTDADLTTYVDRIAATDQPGGLRRTQAAKNRRRNTAA